jgi:hypothetical protein
MKNKLFNEDGTPTEFGSDFLKYLKKDIESLFDSGIVTNLTNTQIRLLGSWLYKLIGNEVTNIIARRSNK